MIFGMKMVGAIAMPTAAHSATLSGINKGYIMIRKFAGHDVDTPPGTVVWSDCPTEGLTKTENLCYTISMEEKNIIINALECLEHVIVQLSLVEQEVLDKLRKL
jgi:hypothetical protein